MKGDFTRGHRPDAKRKEKYRRVLLQEGRLVLDSDVAASVDAADTLIRDLASDVGCKQGSPNLGYLATPGPLLAVFETLDGVTLPAPGGAFVAYRDYGAKYHERFPSLYVGSHAAGGFVKVLARRKLTKARYPKVRLWLRANASVEVRIQGVSAGVVNANDAGNFKFYDVLVPAGAPAEYDTLEIGFSAAGAANEAWIGFIEGFEAATKAPLFSYTRGRYYLQGLAVESADDGMFWESTFPTSKGFPAGDTLPVAGSYVVAYLEGWERLITRIEDGGILEQALGGVLDTTVRSRAVGQVKLAVFANDGGDPLAGKDDVPAAFAKVDAGTGRLKLTTKVAPDNLDPCAIPEAGGYTGADNRFYRFEVHKGGALGNVEIKWSRNNGSDVFAVASVANTLTNLTLAPGAEVKDGDLIELLDETDDLGDAAPAEVALAAKVFRASQRSVGQLFYAETTATSGQLKLRDAVTRLPVNVPADFANKTQAPRKVRVWHGLLVTKPKVLGDPPVTLFDLGDGIVIELSGAAFRPGDYWQHEARKIKDNQNGPWQEPPHGPERLFAPLALFRYTGENAPLELVRWYDHQYSALCELNADDIAYDGGKVGTDADTVQEALDELYAKEDGGCCDASLSPSETQGDDTARIQQAIDEAIDGATLCLERGIYRIHGTLNIVGRRVTLSGCPHATLLGFEGDAPVFFVDGDACLTLRDLLVFRREDSGPLVQLTLSGGTPGEKGLAQFVPTQVRLEGAALVHAGENGVAIQIARPALPDFKPEEPAPFVVYPDTRGTTSIRAEESILLGAWGVAAEYVFMTELIESVVVCERAGIYAKGAGGLRLRRSSFQGWLDVERRKVLIDAADEDLEKTVTRLIETEAGGYNADSVGIGVSGVDYWRSEFEQCTFACGSPVLIGYLYDLLSVGNEYVGAHAGIRVDYLYQCRMSGDRFSTSGAAGVWLPWLTSSLKVEGCTFTGQRGILLAASADGSPLPALESTYPSLAEVGIHDNQFLSYLAGVQIGPSLVQQQEGTSPPVVSMEGVAVTANVFSNTSLGVACTLMPPPPWGEEPEERTQRLRIAGNQLDAAVGVLALGNDVVVQGNTVRGQQLSFSNDVLGLPLHNARQVGLYLADGGYSAVQDNVITLSAVSQAEKGGSVGILLYERWTEGERDGITVQDNTVTASTPFWVAEGETGAGTHGLLLEGNRFTGLGCRCEQLYESVLRNNVFTGGIRITISGGNTISGNRLSQLPSSHIALRITQVWGDWQIEDNRVDGSIVLTPYAYTTAGVASTSPRFIESLQPWVAPADTVNRGTVRVAEVQPILQTYTKALAAAAIDKEYSYNAQVQGNWVSADLVVGWPNVTSKSPYDTYPAAVADTYSGVQIVGNRVGAMLVTNTYSRLVFAHNFATDFSIPGWSQTGIITAPNFNAP
ncbi:MULTISPECIES: DUF6519 domain-containing protein [unclassified Corallococcus]|uniref:DUF6519 domain-containing protein n=1 Tax=unclassified Corallococcus TaxID=2685029 RepID=UPI001A8F311D|nr:MULTISPECIES: DUF6519 domain-containing protein [unclassified Corallococcus]MBN9686424.1 hypothetical protein [Corallococcus sp. NCSPR001]WAS82148.1 DUF6519 domain-containing protein [Corallococcus sp. NCRR]